MPNKRLFMPSASEALEDNLILWLDANNSNSYTGSGSTWFDVSGNNYDAEITTSVPSTGTVNGATYLNLSTRADYFKIPSSVHGGALSPKSGKTLTYLFWVRLPSIPSGVGGLNVFLEAKNASNYNHAYCRYYKPGVQGFNFFIYDTTPSVDINSGYIASINTTDWFMLVLDFNYPTQEFGLHRYQPNKTNYNNHDLGNVSPQQTVDTDIYLFSSPLSVYGGYGYLGEIRMYDTTFTTSELDAKYNAQKGKYGIS
tara:strand:+ start:2102 stop:2866 length:765 start_codon:yes stop_codon:yes gene_type:complete